MEDIAKTSVPERLEEVLAAQSPSLAKRLVPWAVLFVLLAGLVLGAKTVLTRERAVEVDVVEVANGEVERTVASVSAGRVAARRRSRIASDVVGRIIEIRARKGDRVAKGDVVIELDGREACASRDMARAAHGAALAGIEEAKTRLEMARGDHDRRKKPAPGVIAPELVERSAKEVAAWESTLASWQARENEAQARIRSVEATCEKLKIRAPFDGVISEMWVEVGEVTMTMPSASGGTRLFEVLDPEDLYVTAPVDEVDLARVRPGLDARVTLDPWPRDPIMGKVVKVAPYVLDVEDQNRTVEIEVSLPIERVKEWKDRVLVPGTSADVEIIVEREASRARLPAHLLLDGRRVLVTETKGDEVRVGERLVETGIENWRFAEVKDLPLGTRVIAGAAGDTRVKPGQLVTIRRTLAAEANDK